MEPWVVKFSKRVLYTSPVATACYDTTCLIIKLTISHLQSEKLALMESMKHELEEKIRKLEEDKQNMDISAGKIIFFFCIIAWDLQILSKKLRVN